MIFSYKSIIPYHIIKNIKRISLLIFLLFLSFHFLLSESVDDTILFALVENNSNTDVSARDFEMFKSMLVLIGSVIAAVASIIAALISARNQKKLKKMEEYRAEQDARREYEYEARKRVYREFEPLIFMLC